MLPVPIVALIVKFVSLLAPVNAGLEPITRTLYAEPVAAVAGIVAEIVPELTDESVPMFTGLANEPVELDS